MSKSASLKDFVTGKKAWRKKQTHLPMSKKARVVEDLRDRHLAFRSVRDRRKPAHS